MGRLYNGTTSRVNFATADLRGLQFTFGTFAAVYSQAHPGAECTLWSLNNGVDGEFFISATDLLTMNIGGTLRTAATAVPQNVTVLSVVTKATGTTTPRAHLYRFDTGVWVHQDMSGTHANFVAMTSQLIGALNTGGSEAFQGEMWAMGLWQGLVMTDSDCQRLARGRWPEMTPDFYAVWSDGRELSTVRTLGKRPSRGVDSVPLRGVIRAPAGFEMGVERRRR